MSAAQPADPGPPTPTPRPGEDADVIPITQRRSGRGAPDTFRGRKPAAPTPPTPTPSEPDARAASILSMLADDMEKAFNGTGRTLTDNETAAVFVHSLALVQHTLKGAAVNGLITDEQRDHLTELIEGMRAAPRHV